MHATFRLTGFLAALAVCCVGLLPSAARAQTGVVFPPQGGLALVSALAVIAIAALGFVFY